MNDFKRCLENIDKALYFDCYHTTVNSNNEIARKFSLILNIKQ